MKTTIQIKMKEITELVKDSWKPLVKKPQIPEFWSHGGNKGTSLCLQLIQKTRTRAQCHKKNCSHHQTNHDKTILFQLNKSSPQSTPALPGNPSSTKSFCQLHHWLFPQGLWQPGITNWATGGFAFVRQKNISWCLTAGKDNSSNTGILKFKPLHFHKHFYSHYKKVILTSLTLHKILPRS